MKITPASGTTELPTVRVLIIWARDGVCEAGAGQERMLIGTQARRSNNIFHSEGRDGLVLCLLKLKLHICTKKKPNASYYSEALCYTASLSAGRNQWKC